MQSTISLVVLLALTGATTLAQQQQKPSPAVKVAPAPSGPASSFFPARPASASLKTAEGIIDDYGVGNKEGSFSLRDATTGKRTSFYVGDNLRINQKIVRCMFPPTDANPAPGSCEYWPPDVRLGHTRVKVTYWETRHQEQNGMQLVSVSDQLETQSVAKAQSAPLVHLGTFFLKVITEEHIYGYQVDIWREGSHVFGISAMAQVLQGDGGASVSMEILDGRFNPTNGTYRVKGELAGEMLGTIRGTELRKGDGSLKPSPDRMGINPASAPTTAFQDWKAWAASLANQTRRRSVVWDSPK